MSGTLLVTGGAGFIGSHVVDAAIERGWRVRVIDSLRADVHAADLPVSTRDDVEFIHADLADPRALTSAVRGVEAVCHQAAKVGLGVDFADAPDYVRSNDLATATLLAAMTGAGVRRLVLASSMVVYGEGRYRDALGAVAAPPRAEADLEAGRFEPVSPRTGEPLEPLAISEEDPVDPRNVYAASKLMQEHLCAVWARETGGAVAALRYHNVYGPGMPQATPYAGVAAIFRSSLEAGSAPRVFEDGGQRRDFIHVGDVAAANAAALQWTATVGRGTFRPFNVGSGEVRTVGEMARALAAAFGGPAPVVTGRFRLGDVRHITASSRRIQEELGWRASVGFDEGMRQFAAAPLRPPAARTR
jgi:dTDP-L-rhamnose 4-epimerase